jgi:hypothetical protein
MGNMMDCNAELATRLIMSELDIDADVETVADGVTVGRKFYKLPNWMRAGELINFNNYSKQLLGMVTEFEVLGVIGGNTTACRFRDNYSIKGNLLVKFSVLMDGTFHYYYGTVPTWKKVCNAFDKIDKGEKFDIESLFTVRKLMFTWKHPQSGLDGYQAQVVYPSSFQNAEFLGVHGGWWV